MSSRQDIRSINADLTQRALIDLMERRYPGAYKTGEIFPGDTAPAIIASGDRIVPVPAVFGFPGLRDGRLLINARGETAAEKKTFAESLKVRRMILPATGFYEWDAAKTKYLFTAVGQTVLYLCGLYKMIDRRYRFVILTRAANGSMIGTHDRMPVIAGENEVRPYLSDLAAATEIIATAAPELVRQKA